MMNRTAANEALNPQPEQSVGCNQISRPREGGDARLELSASV